MKLVHKKNSCHSQSWMLHIRFGGKVQLRGLVYAVT